LSLLPNGKRHKPYLSQPSKLYHTKPGVFHFWSHFVSKRINLIANRDNSERTILGLYNYSIYYTGRLYLTTLPYWIIASAVIFINVYQMYVNSIYYVMFVFFRILKKTVEIPARLQYKLANCSYVLMIILTYKRNNIYIYVYRNMYETFVLLYPV